MNWRPTPSFPQRTTFAFSVMDRSMVGSRSSVIVFRTTVPMYQRSSVNTYIPVGHGIPPIDIAYLGRSIYPVGVLQRASHSFDQGREFQFPQSQRRRIWRFASLEDMHKDSLLLGDPPGLLLLFPCRACPKPAPRDFQPLA